VCTFERNDSYADVRVVNPLPRCAPHACYSRISLCEPIPISHSNSWRGVAALDALIGFPVPSIADAAVSAKHGVLHVTFALRRSWHGRNLLNVDSLVERCDHINASGWRVRCRARALAAMPLFEVVRVLRITDVFVSMHGAT